ncbi:MAG TPA: YggS family pyridoxal phosphate-dependent enzyme [Acidimicrobiia bacterium]|nr:YggS family pyridoxal phosphate-dependent enzyme [Acidimicrobiia bacterium]
MVAVSYDEVVGRIAAAAQRSGRDPAEITLVAVSKSKPVSAISDLYEAGHRDFGENRAQEMADKAALLPKDIRWHFIGALQTNKTRLVRPITYLLHSMDRQSLAFSWAKGMGLAPPVLIQVNTGAEPQKAGAGQDEVMALLDNLLDLGIEVRGLMAIPPLSEDPEQMRPHFRELRRMRDQLVELHGQVRELSMGMTDDFEIAIEEGASLIRVGRAIFGART